MTLDTGIRRYDARQFVRMTEIRNEGRVGCWLESGMTLDTGICRYDARQFARMTEKLDFLFHHGVLS
jgi:predicted RNA-binding protein with PUA-like domain